MPARCARSVPDSYAVLFLHGGATGQFTAVPLNFLQLNSSHTADYLVTGYWSEKAAKEAEKFGKINHVIPKQDKYNGLNIASPLVTWCYRRGLPFAGVPAESTWKLTPNASYFYYCSNETIHGIEFEDIPNIVPKETPIVCDMSSNFLSRPFDVTKVSHTERDALGVPRRFDLQFSVIFASAQKNFGASGLVLVIVRKDLVEKVTNKTIPVILDYKVQIANGSMYNTPPTFSYVHRSSVPSANETHF